MTDDMAIYSDNIGTLPATSIKLGNIYYINGKITIKEERSYTSVTIDVCKSDGTFVEEIMNSLYDFSANTPATIRTINNNITATCPPLVLSKEKYSPQRYYLRLRVAGNGVETTQAFEKFVVEHCNVQNTHYYTTNNADDQKITKYNAGDVAYVEGSFYTDVGIDDVQVVITITDPNAIATEALNTTFDAAAADDNDLRDDVNGGTAITYQLGTVGGMYQIAVQVIRDGWVTPDTSYSYFYVPEQTTFGEEAWFNETIVYEQWTGAYGDFGSKTYGTPQSIPARIKQSEKKVKIANGEKVLSVAQILIGASEIIVSANDRITLPDATQPVILTVKATTNPDGSKRMQEVFT